MLKTAKLVIGDQLLYLLDKIFPTTFYPSSWKLDILSVLHKSRQKNDHSNFCGLLVSSASGKLFNKIFFNCLSKYCEINETISQFQESSEKKTRTSDHLIIIWFMIDKSVLNSGRKLSACFVELKFVYTVPGSQFF